MLVTPPGGTCPRAAIPGNGRDDVVMRMDRRRRVVRSTGGANGCPGDTFMQIRFNVGLLAEDDDGAGSGCSHIDPMYDAGDCRLQVRGYNGVAVPAHQIITQYL